MFMLQSALSILTLKHQCNVNSYENLNNRQILRCRGHVDNKPNGEIRPSNIETGTYVRTIGMDIEYIIMTFSARICNEIIF